jgi:hypothetical protein
VQFLSDLELICETCTKLLDALADHSPRIYNELSEELIKAFEKSHPPFAKSRETVKNSSKNTANTHTRSSKPAGKAVSQIWRSTNYLSKPSTR